MDRCARYCRTVDFVANVVNVWDTSPDYLSDVT